MKNIVKMNDKVYDVSKWIALIVLPAVAILYETLASIWGLPFAEQIPATITAVDLFLGVILGVSNAAYKKSVAKNNSGVSE